MPNIVFGGVRHCVLQGNIGEIGASNILFDIFNSCVWA